jgi:hypothetical protein
LRLRRVIAESAPQLANRAMQDIVRDEHIGPDAPDQLFTSDDLARRFGKQLEDLHHLRLDAHVFAVARQPVERRVDLPLANRKRLHRPSIGKTPSRISSQTETSAKHRRRISAKTPAIGV